MLKQFPLDLTNSNNLYYTGPVFLGTPLQGSSTGEFVYDTGSGWLAVKTQGCTNCGNIYYNPASSSTAAASSYVQSQLVYGSATLNGQSGADTVCLIANDPLTCVTNFSFFEVLSQNGISFIDGILGLSPGTDGNGPSYMMNLYNQGKIANPEATFWINLDTTATSSVTFGGPPTGAVRSNYTE
jgi:hypothetical protein